jgi:outer membrane protein assembly factor BamB
VDPSRRHLLATVGATLVAGCAEVDGLLAGGERRTPPPPTLSESADWEQPGHDARRTRAPPGHAAPDALPATPAWTESLTATQLDRLSTPVVADGQVYVALGGVDRGEEFERLLALDARTGERLWDLEVTGSAFAYAPVVAGDVVVWPGDGGHGVAAADGGERWRHDGTDHVVPVAAHGLVLTTGGAREPTLEALDPATGDPFWTRTRGERRWIPLAGDDEAFYATLRADTDDQSPELHAIDPVSGETRWSTAAVAPREAALNATHLFASTGRPDARELVALDLAGRTVDWSATRDLQRTSGAETINGQQTVAAVTDDVLLVHLDFHGYEHDRVEARSPESGAVRWSHDPAGDGIVSIGAPVVAGRRVFLTETTDREDGPPASRLRVLDLRDGDQLAVAPLSDQSHGAPVVADGSLFYGLWRDDDEFALAARFPR